VKETGIKNLRNQAVLYGFAIMALCAVISLPVLGFDPLFLGGLVLGSAVSSLNIALLTAFAERAVLSGRMPAAIIGFVLRIALYAGALGLSFTMLGVVAGIGTSAGFLTTHAAVFYLNGIKPRIFKKADREDRDAVVREYVRDDAPDKRRYLLVKRFSMTKYRGGTTYVTHRRFRKRKGVGGRRNA
jgi:hypothetical protein